QSQKSQIPPPIQLKLSSKKKRDELLAKKREKKELTTAILDKGTDKPVNIYISEVLTKRNRYLFKLARDLRRSDRINTKTINTIKQLKFNSENSLKLFYFNARSLNDKLTELEFLLDEANCRMDALMITETWSRPETEQSMCLSNYQCFFASRSTRRGGGSAIFIHNDIHCKPIHNYCDEHNSFIAVEVGDREKTVLVCVYRPPEPLSSSLDCFFQHLDTFLAAQACRTTIVTGDFNLDLLTTTTAVQRYTNIVLSNGFIFCGHRPTRFEACLDHILTNNTELQVAVQQLQYNLFDHDAMFIEATRTIDCISSGRVSFTKTDVNKLRLYLQQHPPNTSMQFSVEENYNVLLSQLRSGIEASSTQVRSRGTKQTHSKPWFDNELKQCIRTKNYCITGTWDVVREVLGSRRKSSKGISSRFSSTDDKQRCVDDANTYFAAAGKHLAENIPYTAMQPINPQTDQLLVLEPVPRTIVLQTIASLPASKSTGYDACQPNFFKACGEILADSVADVVNTSIRQSLVPNALKLSKVVPIPKTPAARNVSEFRPINIPSVTDKVLQKIVNKQLTEHLERNHLLSPRQYGFRPKSNTQSALFDAVVEIQRNCDQKLKVAAVFLDLSKAFDTCEKRILLRSLSELGVNGQSLRWFESFLGERQQYVCDNGLNSEPLLVDYGVVQGSIVGPTLFNCYVNNLKDLPLHGTLFMYADDIVLVYAASTYEELQSRMNEDLCHLCRWMNQHKLTVNIPKTKYMLFNAPSWTRLDVVYNGECIDYVDAFKYLGVWLDSGLKWTVHIEKLNKTLAQVAGVFKRVSSVLPTQTKRMLYFSLFYSHLIYGIAVWGTAGSTALNLLQTTQNKAIKNLFGYHYRTSTALIHSNNRFLS
ncbi:hypothetical protein pipiens_019378, partial [Culex pipiens pipiens]